MVDDKKQVFITGIKVNMQYLTSHVYPKENN